MKWRIAYERNEPGPEHVSLIIYVSGGFEVGRMVLQDEEFESFRQIFGAHPDVKFSDKTPTEESVRERERKCMEISDEYEQRTGQGRRMTDHA